MRRVFGKMICEIARDDPKAVLIVGDIGYGVFDEFRNKYSKRFYNLGICEQSIISVAAGMIMHRIMENVRALAPEAWQLTQHEREQLLLDWALKSVKKSDAILKHLGL